MLFMDTKDFRKFSDYPCAPTEEAVTAVLLGAGVSFDKHPLGLRMRIKDLDARGIWCKADLIDDDAYSEFRLNIYLPPAQMIVNWVEFTIFFNAKIRHQIKHIAQVRNGKALVCASDEDYEALEVEAREYEHGGEPCLLASLSPVSAK